jgi:hypothetical protein
MRPFGRASKGFEEDTELVVDDAESRMLGFPCSNGVAGRELREIEGVEG